MIKELKRLVVTGTGTITSSGNSVEEFRKNCIACKNDVAPVNEFDTTNFKTKFASEVKDFAATNYFERNDARKYNLFTQYAVAATAEFVKNAGIDFKKLNKKRIGGIRESGRGGQPAWQNQLEEIFKGNKIPSFNPYFVPKIIADIPFGAMSIRYGLRGLNFSTISACASSNHAIMDTSNYNRPGKANVINTGGIEATINEGSIGGFVTAKALSAHNDNPAIAARPLDLKRDGFVMGEGAATLMVESLDAASKRSATILCEIIGTAMAGDAYLLTGTNHDGERAYRGMLDALGGVEIDASQIVYVNAHATLTPLGDESELKAIARVFGEQKNTNISGTKSMTAHLPGAAMVIEAILTVKVMEENRVPPTIDSGEVEADWKDKFNLTLATANHREINFAVSNVFGFGGPVATTIFKKYTA